jgi:hypothetical protein
MTTPDGTEPTYFAAPGPMPAPEPLAFPPNPEPDVPAESPAEPVPAAYPPGYPPYPATAYPPGYPPYPAAAYPPGYPGAEAAPPGYPGYPPGYPGYIPAAYPAYGVPMYLIDTNDPLVTAPGQRFRGWWGRTSRILRQHWSALLPIILVTYALPAALSGGASSAIDRYRLFIVAGEFDGFGRLDVVAGVMVLLGLTLGTYLSAVGWAATAWTVTRRAGGHPTTFGESMTYGFRRSLPLFGWQFLTSATITVAACCLSLPGLYVAFGTSLVMPIAVYARSNPFGGSFSLVHRFFGPILGRMVVLALILAVGAAAAGASEFFLLRAFGLGAGFSGLGAGSALSVLVEVPGQMLFTVGALLVYAEFAARLAPTDTSSLNASL